MFNDNICFVCNKVGLLSKTWSLNKCANCDLYLIYYPYNHNLFENWIISINDYYLRNLHEVYFDLSDFKQLNDYIDTMKFYA